MLTGFTFSAKNDLRNYAKSHHHIKFALSNFKKKKKNLFSMYFHLVFYIAQFM